jgi:hypothetical protein
MTALLLPPKPRKKERRIKIIIIVLELGTADKRFFLQLFTMASKIIFNH